MTCDQFNAIATRDPDISATELAASQDHFENCQACIDAAEAEWERVVASGDTEAIMDGYRKAWVMRPILDRMQDDPEVSSDVRRDREARHTAPRRVIQE